MLPDCAAQLLSEWAVTVLASFKLDEAAHAAQVLSHQVFAHESPAKLLCQQLQVLKERSWLLYNRWRPMEGVC